MKGYVRNISALGNPSQSGLFPGTGNPPANVYCARFLDKPVIYLRQSFLTTPSLY